MGHQMYLQKNGQNVWLFFPVGDPDGFETYSFHKMQN